MSTATDLDSPKLVHHISFIYAISDWFIENESRFLINFKVITTLYLILIYKHHITCVEKSKV